MADIPSKTVWIAWSNTDTTEGRGWSVPLYISDCRATALRLGRKGAVMGSDCEVTPFQAIKIDGNWLAPFYPSEPSKEDLAEQAKYDAKQSAITKARLAGLDKKTIEDLSE